MKSNLTTLCYIEKGSSYLMMHRVKKKRISIKTCGSEWADILKGMNPRRNAFCVRREKKQG